MALLGNYSVLTKSTGRSFGGSTVSGERSQWSKSSALRNIFTSPGWDKKSGKGYGYTAPYSWVMPQRPGAMSSINETQGSSTGAGNLAQGLGLEGTSDGVSTVSNPELALIVALSGTSAGIGQGNAADLAMQVTLSGTAAGVGGGTASAAMNVGISGDASGVGGGTAAMVGLAILSGDVTPFTTLSPENLAAKVWGSVASAFNDAGTMGNKLNSASSAGDPWSTSLPGAYADGTAGKILGQKVLTTNKFIALK